MNQFKDLLFAVFNKDECQTYRGLSISKVHIKSDIRAKTLHCFFLEATGRDFPETVVLIQNCVNASPEDYQIVTSSDEQTSSCKQLFSEEVLIPLRNAKFFINALTFTLNKNISAINHTPVIVLCDGHK